MFYDAVNKDAVLKYDIAQRIIIVLIESIIIIVFMQWGWDCLMSKNIRRACGAYSLEIQNMPFHTCEEN